MKAFARASILLIALFIVFPQAARAAYPFRAGETIRFTIKVFNIEVGYQDMTFLGEATLNGRRVLHATAVTKSLDSIKTMFNYSLHDVNEVWMDPDTLLPIRIARDIQEGSWTDKVSIDMDQARKTARYTDKRSPDGVAIPLTGPTLDILSLIYFARAQQVSAGGVIDADYIVDNKQGVNKTRIAARKGEMINLSGAKVPTLWYEQQGGQGVKVRMTDDDKRIPLSITVGTFKVYGYTIDIVGSLSGYTRG